MWDYEFIKQTVIMTAFVFIIMLDVWGIGYWIVKLVKWIWRSSIRQRCSLKTKRLRNNPKAADQNPAACFYRG